MIHQPIQAEREFNRFALLLIALVIGGTIMLFSASSRISLEKYDSSYFIFQQHMGRMLIAVLAASAAFYTPLKFFRKMTGVVYTVTLLIILSSLMHKWMTHSQIPARWVHIGSIGFQSAEFARFAIILFLANFLAKNDSRIESFRSGIAPPLVMLFPIIALIALTPDFSSAVSLMMIIIFALFIAGMKYRHLFSIAGVMAVISAVYIYIAPYRRQRIIDILTSDTSSGSNYQISQSLMSLSGGGIFGKMLGNSLGKNLYLPEAHTDFIFSILGEEFGFLGTALTLLAFVILFYLMIRLSRYVKDPFGRYFIILTGFSIIVYALLNAAVCVRILPVTGLPMPFVSYSGSQLMMNGAMLGIIFNIYRSVHIFGR